MKSNLLILALFGSFVLSLRASADDSPDFQKERSFNEVYLKYNTAPTALPGWDSVLQGKAANTYKIQKGDTLSALSKTLFGDQFFWPKIWAQNNQQVLNPHEIDTWMQIHFYPGDLNEAPVLFVEEKVVDTSGLEKKSETSKDESNSDKQEQALPPRKKFVPVLGRLPRSLPSYQFEAVRATPPELRKVEFAKVDSQFQVPLIYELNEGNSVSVGEIVATEMGLDSAAEFQYVHVKLRDTSVKKLKVYKVAGQIPAKPKEGEAVADIIENQGEIEVLEPINSNQQIYRAIVTKSLTLVQVGGKLIPGNIETVSSQDSISTTNDVSSQIIGGQFDARRKIVDQYGLIYLKGGDRRGLQVGQVLNVLSNPTIRIENSKIVENFRVVGRVRVVKVSANFATALIVNIIDDIQVGDWIGSNQGSMLSRSGQDELDIDDSEENKSKDSESPEESNSEDELSL